MGIRNVLRGLAASNCKALGDVGRAVERLARGRAGRGQWAGALQAARAWVSLRRRLGEPVGPALLEAACWAATSRDAEGLAWVLQAVRGLPDAERGQGLRGALFALQGLLAAVRGESGRAAQFLALARAQWADDRAAGEEVVELAEALEAACRGEGPGEAAEEEAGAGPSAFDAWLREVLR